MRDDTLRFPEVSRAHFLAWRDWFGANLRMGLNDFTWVDESRAVARVRLLNREFEQTGPTPGVVSVVIRLAVLQEGGTA